MADLNRAEPLSYPSLTAVRLITLTALAFGASFTGSILSAIIFSMHPLNGVSATLMIAIPILCALGATRSSLQDFSLSERRKGMLLGTFAGSLIPLGIIALLFGTFS